MENSYFICFVWFQMVLFRFDLFRFVSFLLSFVSFCFDLFRFVSICFVSFRSVSLLFPFLLYRDPDAILFFLFSTTCATTPFVTVIIPSRYAACSSSSSSWSTCSILVLSHVLFLCQISVTFVSCTQRTRLTFVSYSCVSYHVILVRITFFSIPVMCAADSHLVPVKLVAHLCRIRSFFTALSSLTSSDNNEIRMFIHFCSYLLIL